MTEEVKTKKTNSTGDTTPNRSLSMTSDMMDQLFVSEGYFEEHVNFRYKIKIYLEIRMRSVIRK